MTVSLYSGQCSYSLLRRRLRPSQARVRSTTQRRGGTTKPSWAAGRLTTSKAIPYSVCSHRAKSSPLYPWSAHSFWSVCHPRWLTWSTHRAPSRSPTSAAWTTTASSSPAVSTRMWRLRPRTFLASVVAPLAPGLGRLGALAIDDCGRGLRCPAGLLPRLLHQVLMDLLQGAVPGPLVEVVAHAGPRRELPRQQPPLAARARKVQQRVDDFPQFQAGGAPRAAVGPEAGLEQ